MSVELKNIKKNFGKVKALANVSTNVENGEFLTLLGPSGCGKTTLLRIVAGFIIPDDGEIWIDGKMINNIPPNQRSTGMLFQSYALFPHMTVKENIAFGLKMHGHSKHDIKTKVGETLDLVELNGFENRYPGQLSGGQQQRVALARTLAIEPKVLLLDEPMAALDRKLRMQMRTDLKKLIDRVGITTIFVTHDQIEALTMSDQIAVMEFGKIIQQGSPIEIYDKPKTAFVADFVGNSNIFRGGITKDKNNKLFFKSDNLCVSIAQKFSKLEGSVLDLLIRPEHLNIQKFDINDSNKDKENLDFIGTISFVTNTGVYSEYEVELDNGRKIKVEKERSRDEIPFSIGDEVFLSPLNEDSFWIINSN